MKESNGKMKKKFKLNKLTIANLSRVQLSGLRGGLAVREAPPVLQNDTQALQTACVSNCPTDCFNCHYPETVIKCPNQNGGEQGAG